METFAMIVVLTTMSTSSYGQPGAPITSYELTGASWKTIEGCKEAGEVMKKELSVDGIKFNFTCY